MDNIDQLDELLIAYIEQQYQMTTVKVKDITVENDEVGCWYSFDNIEWFEVYYGHTDLILWYINNKD